MLLRAPAWGKWVTDEADERDVAAIAGAHNAKEVMYIEGVLDDTVIRNQELETTSAVTLYRTDNTGDFFAFEVGDTIITNHHLFTVSEDESWSFDGKPWDLKLLVPRGFSGLFLTSAMIRRDLVRNAQVQEIIVGPRAQWIVRDKTRENVTLEMQHPGGLLVHAVEGFMAGYAAAPPPPPLPRITKLSLISSLKF